MKKYVWLLLSLCAVCWSSIGYSQELVQREMIQQSVLLAMQQQDFAQLEALSNDYRQSQARTASGLWKLTLFYAGLSNAVNAEQINDEAWQPIEQSLETWRKQYPKSPTAHLAYAQMLINRAWAYRGKGYAHSVKDEHWAPFYQYTQMAREYLEQHKKIAGHDPYWYELMLEFAYQQRWPESYLQIVLDEAMKRYPLFYQIYFSGLEYHLPKWGGSAEAIEAFAQRAQQHTAKAEGEGMYARIYWYAAQAQYGETLFLDSRVDWPKMSRGIDDVLVKYPDAWNINHFAKFACMAGDKTKTKQLLGLMQQQPPLYVAWGDLDFYQSCVNWSQSP